MPASHYGPYIFTHYNNFIIFKQSFWHLIQNKDLYGIYREEYWDLYKYSPTFALFMAPIAVLPNFVGFLIWNLLNGLLLFYSIYKFPFKTNKTNLYALLFILIEAITSLQNSQSNCLIAALIILAYIFMEKKNIPVATFFVMLSVFIKPFGLVAFALFILYPDKLKTILYSILWFIVLFALPALIIGPGHLITQYKSWMAVLAADHEAAYGISVMGWLYTWFGLTISKNIILAIGGLLFCAPLLMFSSYKNETFKRLLLASVLVWVVIFNHMAESPTFIICVAGVSIWYFCQEYKKENLALLLFALLFTVLSPTDLFPLFIREKYFQAYAVKAVPCILIWLKIQYDLFKISPGNQTPNPTSDK